MKRLKSNIAFLLLATTAIVFSCLDDPDCYSLNNNIIGLTFKNIQTGEALRLTLKTVTADGTDVVFATEQTASTLLLPLNYLSEQTVFHIESDTINYDLTLQYDTRVQYVSEICGERFVLSDLQVADHNFDSVRVVAASPGKDSRARNIEIFF